MGRPRPQCTSLAQAGRRRSGSACCSRCPERTPRPPIWLDRALGSGTGSEPWYDAARCIRSFAFLLSGDVGRALGLFGDLPVRSAMVPAARTDALAFRGVARLWAGDLQAAAEDLALAVDRISAGVHVRFPCRALAFLAETEFRLGRLG